jgi:hypothetical protein
MSALAPLLAALPQNPELQQKLREVTTAEAFVEVARQAGFDCQPIDLVECFCAQLRSGSDSERLQLFNACAWDFGELAWLLRQLTEREQGQAG